MFCNTPGLLYFIHNRCNNFYKHTYSIIMILLIKVQVRRCIRFLILPNSLYLQRERKYIFFGPLLVKSPPQYEVSTPSTRKRRRKKVVGFQTKVKSSSRLTRFTDGLKINSTKVKVVVFVFSSSFSPPSNLCDRQKILSKGLLGYVEGNTE